MHRDNFVTSDVFSLPKKSNVYIQKKYYYYVNYRRSSGWMV